MSSETRDLGSMRSIVIASLRTGTPEPDFQGVSLGCVTNKLCDLEQIT